MATSVLHNIALLNNDVCETEDDDDDCDGINITNSTAGNAKRNAVVENYFNC